MKKTLTKIILLVVVFLLLGSYIVSYGLEVDINRRKSDKQYRVKAFDFFGVTLLFGDELYFSGENDYVSTEQKNMNNYIIGGTSIVLIIYWISLLIIFEKEDKGDYVYKKIDDLALLKKYNPMIAGCLVDNRQVLPRDVIAVILNLIQNDYIKMEMIPNFKDGKENYTYMISENKPKKGGLDELELYVLNMLFSFYEEERVDFVKKLKELSKRKDFLNHINKLNSKSEKILHKIGANIPRVPKEIRIFNVFLMIFTFLLSVVHIINNGLSVHIYQTTVVIFLFIVAGLLLVIPIVAVTIHLVLFLITIIKRMIKSTTERYTGKKLVQMSFLIIFFMVVIMFLVYLVVPNKYICLDVFMIGMSILIVKTDNLMTKHSKEILDDYYALNEVKYRIEEYSLIKDEQINYIKLWDEYLIYAVAFGIPIPIINKLKNAYTEDDDLRYLAKCENLYYVCKAYLEVMWDMEFRKGTNIFGIDDLFDITINDEELKKKLGYDNEDKII